MWRTILLGKLAISIAASIAVGAVCLYHSQADILTWFESFRWVGIGAFFWLLAMLQGGAIYLLNRKPAKIS